MTDKDIVEAAKVLKIKDVLPEKTKNENIIESCEMINNHPSIIIFGKDTGVRYGYVGYDKKDIKIAEKCEDMTFDKESPIFCIIGGDSVLDAIFSKTVKPIENMRWIAYDCGHSGETFDEKSVREYYPQDAESIIERNEWRNSICGDYSPAVRSLNWCRDANKTIINAFESEHTKKKKQPEENICDLQTITDNLIAAAKMVKLRTKRETPMQVCAINSNGKMLYSCPNCKARITVSSQTAYCDYCGQKLSFGGNDNE